MRVWELVREVDEGIVPVSLGRVRCVLGVTRRRGVARTTRGLFVARSTLGRRLLGLRGRLNAPLFCHSQAS